MRNPKAGQPDHGVDREHDAQRDARQPGIVTREHADAGDRADEDAGHHQPQPPRQRAEARAARSCQTLVTSDGIDQQRRGLGRRQHHRQQAHRDGRQAHADHAFDDAGQQERRADQDPCAHGGKLEPVEAGHNVEVPAIAFGLAEGYALAMRFDLVDLRLVLNVADAGNITHGAARSGLALASASERIRDLERELGAPLFERQRRGVVPTPAGLALVHHARLVTQQLEAMSGELADFAARPARPGAGASNTAATLEVLPMRLGAFLAAHPKVDIEVEERPSPEIVRAWRAAGPRSASSPMPSIRRPSSRPSRSPRTGWSW